jgi:NTP pyrophosphatase (non-canonical NTP hydrolase)
MSGAMDALWDEDMKLSIYKPELQKLKTRILEKHERYGTSYRHRSEQWMWSRLLGEVCELDAEIHSIVSLSENIENEALDVAIVALLIADNARLAKETRVE